jgi:hypothetical protein
MAEADFHQVKKVAIVTDTVIPPDPAIDDDGGSELRNGRSRRDFLKTTAALTAGIAGASALTAAPAWSATAREADPVAAKAAKAATSDFPKINYKHMITPETALSWATFKSTCGPTYAGSTGWIKYTNFLLKKMKQFGLVDIETIEIPYDHYIVDDWPNPDTHRYGSGVEVEKLVSNGKPVPVVAAYGMTSGFTGPDGLTAPMVYYDPASPPSNDDIAGKILVCETAPYPQPPFDDSFLDSYTMTDYEWRSPGKWWPLFTPPPTSVTSSYHSRWVWHQLNGFASTAIAANAAGMVIVYDLSPGAAFGLTQRSVYTATGKAGLGATYINCPTLCLDRVNGADVLRDARRGKTATLTLIARFQRDTGKAFVGYLPGRHYGTAQDQQVMLATHTDAMSLVEEDGGLGMLAIMRYFNKMPKSQRPRTVVFYFDCRHFMPGGEGSWPQYDYYTIHPDKLTTIVATLGMEHMGGRQTIEVGPHGNEYVYSSEGPYDGGLITSLIDVNNNNIWLVEKIAEAATDNDWPRVDAKAGDVEPGVNGGFQGSVKSPMNKGRAFGIPGIGLAGDWPGAWTQSYAQLDTEAGPHGFDENYFVQQVAGLTQLTGELMLVEPVVIDLAWGELKTAVISLTDSAFASPADAIAQRVSLVQQYVTAFGEAEIAEYDQATAQLQQMRANVQSWVSTGQSDVLDLIDTLVGKLQAA